ncbi:MAG: hypothetical protein ABSG10_10475 [Terracidiphilus sp.]|jgi:hypothetical protein
MADLLPNTPVRGTQLLVGHMSAAFRRPSLLAIEIAWRWLFGIPFLLVCLQQGQQLLAEFPMESSGVSSINTQNPWIGAVELAKVCAFYQPHLLALLRWMLPAAALAWVIVSGLGRNLLLIRMEPRAPFRPIPMIAMQAARLVLLGVTLRCWLGCMQWVSATYVTAGSEPNLVGYCIWAIFLALGFFTAFALVSWVFTIAPLVALLERRSTLSALGRSLRLGKPFTGKLVEINLVLGIVKLALLVLALVFTAAPVPFSDELGTGALRAALAAATFIYLVANDYCQVVRLRAFLEFWSVFRGPAVRASAT